MFSLFYFSLGNAFRKKGVAILAILGVALGCTLMTSLLSVSQGMDQMFETTFVDFAGTIIVGPQDSILHPLGQFTGYTFPEEYVERIKKIEDVVSVAPQINTLIPTEILKTPLPIGTPLTGIDLQKEKNGPQESIVEGRVIRKETEILIGLPLKTDLDFFVEDKLKIGDKIKIPKIDPKTRDIVGEIELTLVGIFETGNMLNDYMVVGSVDLVREVASVSEGEITTIIVRADTVENVEKIAKDIEKEFEGAEPGVEMSISKEFLNTARISLDLFDKFLFVIGGIAALSGGMGIFIIMLISVMERMREFGILKAVGWKGSNIIFSILIESLTLSVMGALLGTIFGYLGITLAENYIAYEGIGIINWQVFLSVTLFGILVGIIGGIYPAWRASKIAPMEIFRQE